MHNYVSTAQCLLFKLLAINCLLLSCSTKEGELGKASDSIPQVLNKMGKIASLEGCHFVHGLNCSWGNQSENRGRLKFMSNQGFALSLRLPESNPLKGYEDLALVKYQGRYEEIAKDRIRLIFKEKIKTICRDNNSGNCDSQKTNLNGLETTIEITQCQERRGIQFPETFSALPQLKYFSWVERNYQGKYISYAEGLRKVIEINQEGDHISAYYLPPSDQPPIPLEVIEFHPDAAYLDFKYPEDSISYRMRLSAFALEARTKTGKRQKYVRIAYPGIDNPMDLSLSLPNPLSLRPMMGAIQDSIFTLSNRVKVKMSRVEAEEFKRQDQENAFELKEKLICGKVRSVWMTDSCAQALEKVYLKNEPKVKRDGHYLQYQLSGGQDFYLQDKQESNHALYFQGKLNGPKAEVFINLDHRGKRSSYRLLHGKSGKEIWVNGLPFLSPNGRYFVSFKYLGLNPGDGANLQLWEIKADGFDLRWHFTPNYILKKFVWLNDREIIFEALILSVTEQEYKKAYGKIEFQIPIF